MAAILRISDGTTTLNLIGDTDGYKLIYKIWAPKRAHYDLGLMGGSYHEEVDENPIAIAVSGTSASQVLSRYDALSNLLYKAEIWGISGQGDAVKLQYLPEGSALGSPVEAVIVGRASRRDIIVAPKNFTQATYGGRLLSPVILNLRRRGEWLGATEAKSSATSTGNPTIRTISSTFTDDASILMPYDATIKHSNTPATSADTNVIYYLFTNAANKLYLAEAEGLTLVQFTNTVVSGASAGNVARASVTNTTEKSLTDSGPSFNSSGRKVAFYVMARNLSSSVNWDIWAKAYSKEHVQVGRKQGIAAGDTVRQVVKLGTLVLPAAITKIAIHAQNDVTGSDTSDNLDIDYVCAVIIDDSTRLLKVGPINVDGANTVDEIVITHRLDSDLSPLVTSSTTGLGTISDYPARDGNIALASTGNTISCLIFGNENDGSTWLLEDTSNELDMDLDVTRTLAYLTPV